jgi:Glycosyltransferase like family 2
MGAFMDRCFLGRVKAGVLVLAMGGVVPAAQAFTMTTAPSEAPVVQSQVVGQAALEASLDDSEGTTLQLSEALSIQPRSQEPDTPWVQALVNGLTALIWAVTALWGVTVGRQWLLTMNRLSDRKRDPYAGISDARWPRLTVIVLAHDSQALVGDALGALCAADYPVEQLQIVAVNDRSTDRTRQVIDEQAARHPGRIVAVHRRDGLLGRAACLLSAMPHADGEFLLVLGSHHHVGPGLLKQIMAPFFDPEVGAVSGCVTPSNAQANLLTRLVDLGQSAVRQVEQPSRTNLGLAPHVGSGVVAWRRSALVAACAASSDAMADELDVAHRLALRGWQQVSQGVLDGQVVEPQTWEGQGARVARAAFSQQEAAVRHAVPSLMSRHANGSRKLDACLTHLSAWMPALMAGVAVSVLGLYLTGASGAAPWGLVVLTMFACASVQPHASVFQVAVGARLEARLQSVRLLPLQWLTGVPALVVQSAVAWTRIVSAFRRPAAKASLKPPAEAVTWHAQAKAA